MLRPKREQNKKPRGVKEEEITEKRSREERGAQTACRLCERREEVGGGGIFEADRGILRKDGERTPRKGD